MSKRTYNFRSSTSSSGKSKQFDVNSVLDRTPLSNISNVIDTGERRRIRKRILESKRAKNRTSSSNVGVTLRDKENSSHVSNVTNQLDMTIPFQRSVDATLSSYINSNDNLQNNDVSLCTPGVYSIKSNILTYTNSTSTSNRTSLKYIDHGDQVVICDICYAKLWTSEGGKGRLTLGKLCYGLCCGYGKVELPHLKEANPSYQNLFHMSDQRSKFFLKNIRRYNCMFSFTSMGGKVDSKINKGNAPFIYQISGQNFHSLGSPKPANGKQAKFSQLYIYDTENEVYNRQSVLGQHVTSHEQELDVEIIEYLKDFLDSHNELVKSYRMVRNHFQQNPEANLKLRLIYNRDKDGRTYNLPSSTEVAALIVDDLDASVDRRDIVVETQSGMLKRISELHPSYLALQYPIFFPFGDDGYRIDIPHRDGVTTKKTIRPKCTMREFFAYRIQDHISGYSLVLNGRRLFQQFLVDAYTMIESERLNFIRGKQKNLRSETFENLQKYKHTGQENLSNTGQKVILPSSFTGGARFMQQNYLDAMALCKWFGYSEFFITITCNPKWPEISRFLKDTSIKPEDRPDILC
ncbi:uncharacterized protein LOC110943214 [Helianthus annuus]|uniref:uncharacterized protein LOC110943214 n=1 Tax=Helianthus annuus TaxID=4232 RepID=UPI000B90A113|nr:uncharacterized protein LOC110943214 [Helianthus annuus]